MISSDMRCSKSAHRSTQVPHLVRSDLQSLLSSQPDVRMPTKRCPGHVGVTGNEVIDSPAKEATMVPGNTVRRAPYSPDFLKPRPSEAALRLRNSLLALIALFFITNLSIVFPPTFSPPTVIWNAVTSTKRHLVGSFRVSQNLIWNHRSN